jgi:periplasmic divalent cation tolerance protein
MNTDVLVVYVTTPDAAVAERLARALVEEELAACCSIVPGVRSIYRWEGRVQDDAELLLVIKTTAPRLDALARRVVALHPYAVPEVVALPVAGGHVPYLDWVRANVRG